MRFASMWCDTEDEPPWRPPLSLLGFARCGHQPYGLMHAAPVAGVIPTEDGFAVVGGTGAAPLLGIATLPRRRAERTHVAVITHDVHRIASLLRCLSMEKGFPTASTFTSRRGVVSDPTIRNARVGCDRTITYMSGTVSGLATTPSLPIDVGSAAEMTKTTTPDESNRTLAHATTVLSPPRQPSLLLRADAPSECGRSCRSVVLVQELVIRARRQGR
jgi:hypothetical protein